MLIKIVFTRTIAWSSPPLEVNIYLQCNKIWQYLNVPHKVNKKRGVRPQLCCSSHQINVTNSVESRNRMDHIDFCLTGHQWMSPCSDLSGYWAMYSVCEIHREERLCWHVSNSVAHSQTSPSLSTGQAPYIMHILRPTTPHDNVPVNAWCVLYVTAR